MTVINTMWLWAGVTLAATVTVAKPNIMLIMADDVGQGEVRNVAPTVGFGGWV